MWWEIHRGEARKRQRAENTGLRVVHKSAHTESWKHKPKRAHWPPKVGNPAPRWRQTPSHGMHLLFTLHQGKTDVNRTDPCPFELGLLRGHQDIHNPGALNDCMELTLTKLRIIEVKCCAQGHSQLVSVWRLKFMSSDSQGKNSFWQWKELLPQATEVTRIKNMGSGI